jgi:hypothetical protein
MKEKKIVPNYKLLYITNEIFNVIFSIIPLFVLHKWKYYEKTLLAT